jgi:hypothetical protein
MFFTYSVEEEEEEEEVEEMSLSLMKGIQAFYWSALAIDN